MICKSIFEVAKWRGEKMDSHGKVLKMFYPLKILNSPFSKERLLELFFLSLFYASFSFSMLCLFIEDELRDFWNVWGENNFKLSFKWDGSGYTKIYEIGGLVEKLSAVDACISVSMCSNSSILFSVRLIPSTTLSA
jgi:hypothetical protein